MTRPDGTAVEFTDIEVPPASQADAAQVEIAREQDYDVVTGPVLTVRALSPDGVALVDSMDPAAFDTDTWVLNATTPVNLWTENGLQPVGDTDGLIPEDEHRQVLNAAFAGDSITWLETASIDLFVSDWRIFRRDLNGGEVELLARSEQVHPEGQLPLAVGDAVLAPAADRVGWHTTYVREDGTLRTKLVSIPADGGDLRDEADLVAMPAGAEDGWVALRMIDQSVAGAEEGWEIQDPNAAASIDFIEPGGQARALVEFPGGTSDLWAVARIAAGGGDVYAWAMNDGHIYVSSVDGSDVFRLTQPSDVQVVPHSLAVCGERVAWSVAPEEGSPTVTYLFDPADGEIALLPSENSLGNTTCGGPFVAWTEIALDDPEAHALTLARQP